MHSLTIIEDEFYHVDGSSERLLCAKGTIPIDYANVRYNIPVRVYAPSAFPIAPPMCFVTPTADMIVKPNHGCVDANGRVDLGRVMRWDAKTGRLRDVASTLSKAFSLEPPLFSKPNAGVQRANSANYDGAGRSRASSSAASPRATDYVPFSVRPGASPSPSSRMASAASTSPRGLDANDARAWFRERAITALNMRLKAGAEHHLGESVTVIEKLLAYQTELYTRKISLEQEKVELRAACDRLERDTQILNEKTAAMESWLEAHPETDADAIDPETAFQGADAVSAQLLDAHAKDSAIEDVLDVLDELLNDGKIDLDVYLRQVNKLCKSQFIARAEILVAARVQQERGVCNGLVGAATSAARQPSTPFVGLGFLRPIQAETPPASTMGTRTNWLD